MMKFIFLHSIYQPIRDNLNMISIMLKYKAQTGFRTKHTFRKIQVYFKLISTPFGDTM